MHGSSAPHALTEVTQKCSAGDELVRTIQDGFLRRSGTLYGMGGRLVQLRLAEGAPTCGLSRMAVIGR